MENIIEVKQKNNTTDRIGKNISQEEELKLLDLNQQIYIDLNNNKKNDRHYKILLLGDSLVGKTSLINSIVANKPPNNFSYVKTLGCDIRRKKFQLNENIPVDITFFDFGRFDLELNFNVMSEYFKMAHAIVYVVDLNNIQSLSLVEKLASINNKSSNNLNYLVLNKSDLMEENVENKIKLQPRINNLMNSCNSLNISETSIKYIKSVKTFFNSLLNNLLEFYNKDENVKYYVEKNEIDYANLFFKYPKYKKNKSCYKC